MALEILKILKRNPRSSPKHIHSQRKTKLSTSPRYLLGLLYQLKYVDRVSRGIYVITTIGIEKLQGLGEDQP